MTDGQKERMRRERVAYRQRNGRRHTQQTEIAELRSQIASLVAEQSVITPQDTVTLGPQSQVSQVTAGTQGGSIIGGRNQQANSRQQRK